MDQLRRHVLMAEGTFIRISLFRAASFNGALPFHLPSVQENTQFAVIELGSGDFGQPAVLIELIENFPGYLSVNLPGPAQPGTAVQIQADIIFFQSLFLQIVIVLYKFLH